MIPVRFVRRCLIGLTLLAGLLSVTASAARAAGAGDSASESALLVTGILTIILIAIALLALMLPSDDLTGIAAALSRFRRYFVTGQTRTADTLEHSYDGIQELDNRIPPWFTTLFAATVVFAGIYMLDYHVFSSSPLSADEYKEEIALADLHRRIVLATEGSIDESQLVALTDPAAIQRGAEEYGKYCVSCHGNKGQGLVGPNLTDDYWIHGGGVRNVYATIKQGVPAKGMISWQLVFTPKQIQELASYVLTLRGTNPPGAKKAEGVPYAEIPVAADSTTAQQ
jgi:cytochrome c oxidase cbb3-type subunit 3